MHTVSLTKEKMTPQNPENVYFQKSDAGGAGNVDLLYANTMVALTQHINQHTLAREEKALPHQGLIFITLRQRVNKTKEHSHQIQRINLLSK